MTSDEQIYITENLKLRVKNKRSPQAPLISSKVDHTHSTTHTHALAHPGNKAEVAGVCLACPSRWGVLLFKTKQTFFFTVIWNPHNTKAIGKSVPSGKYTQSRVGTLSLSKSSSDLHKIFNNYIRNYSN